MIVLGDSTFDKVVYHSPDVWIVVFSVEQCKHCKTFAPIYEATAKALDGKVKFGYVDVLKNRKLLKRFNLKSVPKIFYYEPGYYKTDADAKSYDGEKTIEAL